MYWLTLALSLEISECITPTYPSSYQWGSTLPQQIIHKNQKESDLSHLSNLKYFFFCHFYENKNKNILVYPLHWGTCKVKLSMMVGEGVWLPPEKINSTKIFVNSDM